MEATGNTVVSIFSRDLMIDIEKSGRSIEDERLAKKKAYQRDWYQRNKDRQRQKRRQWEAGNKHELQAKSRARTLKRKYGLTVEEWDALFLKQGSRCAVCASDEPKSKSGWHTDHCHESGSVRGILCHSCNLLLGNAEDSTDTLSKAIDYLKKINVH